MHGSLPSPAAPKGAPFRLILTLALREFRGGLKGFGVFLACLAIGVMAISGVASLSRSLTQGLEREGRRILGADLAFILTNREALPQERAFLDRQGQVSRIANLRAMAIAENGDSAMVEVKAVDDGYPMVGALEVDPPQDRVRLLAKQDAIYGAAADPVLLARLGLKIGDIVSVGQARIALRASIVSEPDKIASGIGFGPRLLISQEALTATGLVQPGSLVRWSYRILLTQGDDVALTRIEEEARRLLPDAGWEIRSRANADPRFARNIERFTQFLTLVGLTALLVGGVGVAGAAKGLIDRKRASSAILKSLGAPGGFVVMVYLAQSLMVALLGVLIGLILGAALPFLLAAGLNHLLPLPIEPVLALSELLVAAAFGMLTALAFSLMPLGRAHDAAVAHLFRDLVAPVRRWPRLIYILGAGASILALLVLALVSAYDQRIALAFIAAAGGAFVLLRLASSGVMRLAAALPRFPMPALRLAVGNLHRPGALTPSLMLALGLGVTLLTALSLIDANLRSQLNQSLPEKAPSFFFIDIPSREADEFSAFLEGQLPHASINRVPMMRGRLTALNGVPASQIKARDDAAWILDGDRGITYAPSLPEGSVLEQGTWWPADYDGPPLVSFDARIAEGVGLKLGDTIEVNVLGRPVEARIANLRRIEWRSLGINFVMVFSPNTFRGAPHTELATLTPARSLTAQEEAQVLRASAKAYPNVTAIRVREALEAVDQVVSQLVNAIRGASLIALVSSLLVLAGALSASRQARLYDAVLFKTLGASRARLLRAYALEYGMIGGAAGLFGLMAGTVAAYFILTKIMNLEFVFMAGGPILAALLTIGLILIFGLLGTVRILAQKPAPYLRSL